MVRKVRGGQTRLVPFCVAAGGGDVVGRLGPKRVPWQDAVSRVESSVRRAPLTWIRVRGQEKTLLLCVFRHCATMSS